MRYEVRSGQTRDRNSGSFLGSVRSRAEGPASRGKNLEGEEPGKRLTAVESETRELRAAESKETKRNSVNLSSAWRWKCMEQSRAQAVMEEL